MTVNQSATMPLSYTIYNPNGTVNGTGTGSGEQMTFLGFENMTLAGHQFNNACKFSEPGDAGKTDVFWLAKGFGTIRSEEHDAQGALVPGSRVEVKTIVNAPAGANMPRVKSMGAV